MPFDLCERTLRVVYHVESPATLSMWALRKSAHGAMETVHWIIITTCWWEYAHHIKDRSIVSLL